MAPVAQLDRAPGFEPVGRRFESCRARHVIQSKSYGPVAQLAEQLTLNQLAEGSSPSRPTKNIKHLRRIGESAFFVSTPLAVMRHKKGASHSKIEC
jgi:hypothetical protein